jgi:hypothetical protein
MALPPKEADMAGDAVRSGTANANPRPWHAPTSNTTVFAAALMIFGGAMAMFEFSLAGWGWVHLILGIVIVLAGCAVLSGALWARFFGVSVAGLGAIANFLWVPYYPLWALTLVAVNVFVVWALCTGMHREADDGRKA